MKFKNTKTYVKNPRNTLAHSKQSSLPFYQCVTIAMCDIIFSFKHYLSSITSKFSQIINTVLLLSFIQIPIYFTYSAPHDKSPSPNISESPPPNNVGINQVEEQNLVMEDPDIPHKKRPRTYKFKEAIYIRLAPYIDSDFFDDPEFIYLIGVGYSRSPKRENYFLDIGFDIISNSSADIYIHKRQVFTPEQDHRFFYSWGLGHHLDDNANLSSFGDYENYLLKANFGFEDRLEDNNNVRLSIDAGISTEYASLSINFGYSFAF